jgi:hypothetical protein
VRLLQHSVKLAAIGGGTAITRLYRGTEVALQLVLAVYEYRAGVRQEKWELAPPLLSNPASLFCYCCCQHAEQRQTRAWLHGIRMRFYR